MYTVRKVKNGYRIVAPEGHYLGGPRSRRFFFYSLGRAEFVCADWNKMMMYDTTPVSTQPYLRLVVDNTKQSA